MKNVELICEELAVEFREARSLDERLGRVLLHSVSCRFCRDFEDAEQVVAELTALRYELQTRRQVLWKESQQYSLRQESRQEKIYVARTPYTGHRLAELW